MWRRRQARSGEERSERQKVNAKKKAKTDAENVRIQESELFPPMLLPYGPHRPSKSGKIRQKYAYVVRFTVKATSIADCSLC